MLSSMLNSQHAIDMNIMIMRAFVLMRQYMLRQASKHDEVRELNCFFVSPENFMYK